GSATRQGGSQGEVAFAPYWNVIVLNAFLDLFGKGVAPVSSSDEWRAVLRRMHDANVEPGGRVCPGDAEVASLTRTDREILERAAFALPARFGSVGGLWAG